MAQIKLSEYTGFLVSELVKARVMSDAQSLEIQQQYLDHPILKSFPVPRFRASKISLTVPLVLESIQTRDIGRFQIEKEYFKREVSYRLKKLMRVVKPERPDFGDVVNRPSPPVVPRATSRASSRDLKVQQEIYEAFWDSLSNSESELERVTLLEEVWRSVVGKELSRQNLIEENKLRFPRNEAFVESLRDLESFVSRHVIVDKTALENILINPETEAVKRIGDSSFQIHVELSEEAFKVVKITGENNQIEFE
jgi:hypothetical protein